jgi:hypothetical protein
LLFSSSDDKIEYEVNSGPQRPIGVSHMIDQDTQVSKCTTGSCHAWRQDSLVRTVACEAFGYGFGALVVAVFLSSILRFLLWPPKRDESKVPQPKKTAKIPLKSEALADLGLLDRGR